MLNRLGQCSACRIGRELVRQLVDYPLLSIRIKLLVDTLIFLRGHRTTATATSVYAW